jgi:hypothetical protein
MKNKNIIFHHYHVAKYRVLTFIYSRHIYVHTLKGSRFHGQNNVILMALKLFVCISCFDFFGIKTEY